MAATTAFKAYNCPVCNAPLTVDEAAERIKCSYCGHTFSISHAPEPQPQQPPPPRQITPSRPSVTRWLSLMPISIFVLVGFILHRAGVLPTVKRSLGTMAGDGMQWDAVAAGPLLADVDGDGYEDFLGRCRRINPDELWVVAFSGADLTAKWRAGPLGDWNARDAVRFAVSGRRVLVTDGRHTARMFDLGSGAALGTVALADRAEQVCGDATATRFFVATVDGERFFVEGEPPARRDGARPAWCRKPGSLDHLPPGIRRRLAAGDPLGALDLENTREVRAPRVPGFRSVYALAEGARAVAVGEKHPGTPLPMLAGFAVGSHAADWSRLLPTIDPAQVNEGGVDVATLAHGTLYAYYPLASLGGGRLIAVDAASGVTRWDVVVPRSSVGSAAEAIVVGAARVYVPHWSWLDVIDAKSGAVIGTVGR